MQTQSVLTFGLRFADFDADGFQDLLLANGHIEPEINEVQNAVTYRQLLELYLGGEEGRYRDPQQIGEPIVGRCVAVGDIDGDVDLDAIVTSNGEAPIVLVNQTGSERQLSVDLEDAASMNRQALGATLTLRAGEWARTEMVWTRGSYLGHSPYTVHFAVPEGVDAPFSLEVVWPDGTVQEPVDLEPGRRHMIVREASGTIRQ